ncbi:site-specific DNA-methyltransferase [Prevotella sp.]|uniref:site-specific DNA-methyltransferase n=1 Tax=Prevotella sp. TaxID=59823 RepID=UPI003DA4134B
MQKLELTWIGKDEPRENIEPRILIENPEYSYGEVETETLPNGKPWDGNMLIHGDNLLALKSLESDYAGCVKCIYIDPPYNTGNAFEHYDDGLEHSIWLSLMRDRLEILRKLLSKDGLIWITLDDNEVHYCKVLCDEIFGRNNFLSDVIWQHSIQGKNDAKTFSLTDNHILVYSKTSEFIRYKLPREAKHNINYSNPDNDPKGDWRSGDVRSPNLRENLKYPIITPSGKIINPPEKGWRWSKELLQQKISTGEIFFSSDEKRIIRKIYLADQDGRVPDTLWLGEDSGTTREANTELKKLHFEFGTPKPERLIERVINISTKESDIVLDSFLGSGTTAAVAQKMGRRYIGVEMGNHAYTHCAKRLQMVIDGTDQGGISKAVNWQGGGGFKFYELAPSLLKEDKHGQLVINKEYNADMLAAAMAKQEGFTYAPSSEIYWKQGTSSEQDFIYTTTQFLTVETLDRIYEEMAEEESLLICCTAFQKECKSAHSNISIKKIPKMLLGRCEFGKDNYNLNIISIPEVDKDDETEE